MNQRFSFFKLQTQRGNTFIGVVIGLLVGIAVAVIVAVLVGKVPVKMFPSDKPVVDASVTAPIDAASAPSAASGAALALDPNAGMYVKPKAAPLPMPAPGVNGVAEEDPVEYEHGDTTTADATPDIPAEEQTPGSSKVINIPHVRGGVTHTAPVKIPIPSPDATVSAKKTDGDPVGDLLKSRRDTMAAVKVPTHAAASRATAKTSSDASQDGFHYYVQVGSFQTRSAANSSRAKVTLSGVEALVSEREQQGDTVFRVRSGPFASRAEANRARERLTAAGISSELLAVPK